MNPLSNILKQRERGYWDFSICFFIGSSWVHLVMVSNWNCQMLRYGISFLLSYALYCHLHLWCVLSCYGSWVLFYLVQSDRVSHRCVICFILSCPPYVLFYPTCSMFYFTLSIRIAIFIRCVIMCHHVMSMTSSGIWHIGGGKALRMDQTK
jgi:hypothetical protein